MKRPKKRADARWVKAKALDLVWHEAGITRVEIQHRADCSPGTAKKVLNQLVAEGEIIETISADRRTPAYMQGY